MKKLLVWLLATGFLVACNSHSEHTGTADSAAVDQQHEEHNKPSTGLVLNNGEKWKSDSTTLVNVALMQTIVANAKKESPLNYTQAATQLQDGLNKMVKECTMKGPDHDVLHQWLEPLMKQVKELSESTSVETASARLNEIEQQLNLFAQFFE